MNYLLAIALVAYHPQPCGVATDSADILEWNHTYSSDGSLTFTQLLPRDWIDGEHRCQAWRIPNQQSAYPVKIGNRYLSLFYDNGALRVIWARSRRETWYVGDCEVQERSVFPECKRKGLTSPPGRN